MLIPVGLACLFIKLQYTSPVLVCDEQAGLLLTIAGRTEESKRKLPGMNSQCQQLSGLSVNTFPQYGVKDEAVFCLL